MAWGWSHTVEAYANAEENLRSLPKEKLEEIFAEWRAADGKGEDRFNTKRYDKACKWARTQTAETLADLIWPKVEQQALCSNGGHQAWVCPYGCCTVSFDKGGPSDADN